MCFAIKRTNLIDAGTFYSHGTDKSLEPIGLMEYVFALVPYEGITPNPGAWTGVRVL